MPAPLSARAAAEARGVSEKTIRNWIHPAAEWAALVHHLTQQNLETAVGFGFGTVPER